MKDDPRSTRSDGSGQEAYAALVGGIAAHLDLGSGTAEVDAQVEYASFTEFVRHSLDLERGLAAASAARGSAPPPWWHPDESERTAGPLSPAPASPDLRGPTVARLVLGTELRRLREAAGISRAAAAATIGAPDATVSRLELGRIGIQECDLEDLLTLYGVTDSRRRTALTEIVSTSGTRGWWQRDSDLGPAWFEIYLGLEQVASSIRCLQLQFVPDLLQTEEYARRTIASSAYTTHGIDRRVRLLMSRQKMLTEPGSPHLWAVLDEGVLHRPVVPPHVRREQFEHLLQMTELPNVTVQVLPFSAGNHAACGPFSILRFAEPDLPDVVYLEQLNSGVYLDSCADLDAYGMIMDEVGIRASTPEATRELIRRLLRHA